MTPTSTENMKENLAEAGSHLKAAAGAAGEAIKGAGSAAGDELRLGRANVKAELADSALAGLAAAELGGDAAREQMDALMDKGRDLIDSASELTERAGLTLTHTHRVGARWVAQVSKPLVELRGAGGQARSLIRRSWDAAMQVGGRLDIRLTQRNGTAELTFTDTGCGMTREVMERMFEANFSTKAGPDETGKGGSGLGLAIVAAIVGHHHGRVEVLETDGGGATFRVRLPLSPS